MYRTLLGVSKEFVLIGCVLRKRSVFILYFTHPHLFNENKLRTHTLQARCGTFTLLHGLDNVNKLLEAVSKVTDTASFGMMVL